MYKGDIFSTSIVEEKFYNVIITNLTVGDTVINMDCKEVYTVLLSHSLLL